MRRLRPWLTIVVATAGCSGLLACSGESMSGGSGAGGSGGSGAAGSAGSGAGGSGGRSPAGCPDVPAGHGGAPALGAAAVISGDTICLAFTEAMAPPDHVNPEAFRLSRAVQLPAGKSYFVACSGYVGAVSYCAQMPTDCTGHYADHDACESAAYEMHGTCRSCVAQTATADNTIYYGLRPVGHDAFRALTQAPPNDLLASVGLAFGFGVCEPQTSNAGQLYLHYADSTPPVESASGEPLAPIAPAFVHAADKLTAPGLLAGHPVPVDDAILSKLCAGEHCTDGLRNDGETDVDCGGPCKKCAAGNTCRHDKDCESNDCQSGVCS